MPQSSEELVNIYKKVIEPKLKDWVVFEHGTCVIIYHPPKDLKADSGWVVAGSQPGILNYVSENEREGKEDYEIGLIGRNQKEQDSKELKVVYTNSLR